MNFLRRGFRKLLCDRQTTEITSIYHAASQVVSEVRTYVRQHELLSSQVDDILCLVKPVVDEHTGLSVSLTAHDLQPLMRPLTCLAWPDATQSQRRSLIHKLTNRRVYRPLTDWIRHFQSRTLRTLGFLHHRCLQ